MTRHSNYMVNKIYSVGGYRFNSAKELEEFKIQFPDEWELMKDSPLRLSGLSMRYDDFVDYLDSLQNKPDICLAYRADNARGHGLYTTLWVDKLEIRGIFGYYESDSVYELVDLINQFITQSKWAGMKIRTNLCR